MTVRILDMTVEQLAPAALAAGVRPSELLVALIELAGAAVPTPQPPEPPAAAGIVPTPAASAAAAAHGEHLQRSSFALSEPPTATLSPWAVRAAASAASPGAAVGAVVLVILEQRGPSTYPELLAACGDLLRHPISAEWVADAMTALAAWGCIEPDPIAGRGRLGRRARRWRVSRPILELAVSRGEGA